MENKYHVMMEMMEKRIKEIKDERGELAKSMDKLQHEEDNLMDAFTALNRLI